MLKLKSLLKIILVLLGASFLNIIFIIYNFELAVFIGGVFGLVSFMLAFSQLESNIRKSVSNLLLLQLAISCISMIGLELYCRTLYYKEWCSRNLFILSSFPLYVVIIMLLVYYINRICRKGLDEIKR